MASYVRTEMTTVRPLYDSVFSVFSSNSESNVSRARNGSCSRKRDGSAIASNAIETRRRSHLLMPLSSWQPIARCRTSFSRNARKISSTRFDVEQSPERVRSRAENRIASSTATRESHRQQWKPRSQEIIGGRQTRDVVR